MLRRKADPIREMEKKIENRFEKQEKRHPTISFARHQVFLGFQIGNPRLAMALPQARSSRTQRRATTTKTNGRSAWSRRRAFRCENEGWQGRKVGIVESTRLFFARVARRLQRTVIGETRGRWRADTSCGGGYLRAGIIEGATALRRSFYHRVSYRRRNRARVVLDEV